MLPCSLFTFASECQQDIFDASNGDYRLKLVRTKSFYTQSFECSVFRWRRQRSMTSRWHAVKDFRFSLFCHVIIKIEEDGVLLCSIYSLVIESEDQCTECMQPCVGGCMCVCVCLQMSMSSHPIAAYSISILSLKIIDTHVRSLHRFGRCQIVVRRFSLIRWIYKNVSCEIIVPHLFSLNIMLCVGDDPLLCMTALLLAWCVFVRRMVDMKLVSHAPAADDIPNRWWGCCNGLQHKYRWKCCRNTPDTQYNATGFTHEFRKLTTKWIEQREHF